MTQPWPCFQSRLRFCPRPLPSPALATLAFLRSWKTPRSLLPQPLPELFLLSAPHFPLPSGGQLPQVSETPSSLKKVSPLFPFLAHLYVSIVLNQSLIILFTSKNIHVPAPGKEVPATRAGTRWTLFPLIPQGLACVWSLVGVFVEWIHEWLKEIPSEKHAIFFYLSFA